MFQSAIQRNNTLVLTACQALGMLVITTLLSLAVVVGARMTDDPSLATMPLGAFTLGALAASIPASMLMKRLGRRAGFTVGTVFGVVGQGLAAFAVYLGSLPLLCLGCLLTGGYGGFITYYRFAAADIGDEASRRRALSFVMGGGVVAALVGPEIGKLTAEMWSSVTYVGSFIAMAAITVLATVAVQGIRIPFSKDESRQRGRPLVEIIAQPAFLLAAISSMLGYGVMTLMMGATPLAVVASQHSAHHAPAIIQWHMVAMFLPSFFTGTLINRFGAVRMMILGAAIELISALVGLSGQSLPLFWIALVLMGIGWNFLYIASSTLLTTTYRAGEKAKTQAINDFVVAIGSTAGAMSSGLVIGVLGWSGLNVVIVGIAAVVLLALVYYARGAVAARPASVGV